MAGYLAIRYAERRLVDLTEEKGFAVLVEDCATLQDFDWARLTFELDNYMFEVHRLVAGTLHTPSVDVLMHSVARVFGSHAMGVILTGMGADGAQGMKALRDAGGWTIGQDAESCAVYGMPRSAAEINALSRVASLSHIAAEIMAALTLRASAAMSATARSAR